MVMKKFETKKYLKQRTDKITIEKIPESKRIKLRKVKSLLKANSLDINNSKNITKTSNQGEICADNNNKNTVKLVDTSKNTNQKKKFCVKKIYNGKSLAAKVKANVNRNVKHQQTQKHLQDLKIANKALKCENDYLRKVVLRSMTSYLCTKNLQEELDESNIKCQHLEMLLRKKTEQLQRYENLIKEISSNVNFLIKDLEIQNGEHSDQLKKLTEIQEKSECLMNNYKCENRQILSKKANNIKSITSTSNTLIDADSSFDSFEYESQEEPRILELQFKPIKSSTHPTVPSSLSSFDASLSNMENNDICNQDDDDNITLRLDDMSITTIETCSDIGNQVDKNSSMNDKEFQSGLQELDQKIIKAKKLLLSMKIK